nr:Uncharacterised protein [Raoultella sp. NCTC 9187]
MAQLVIFLAAQQDAGEDIVDFATVGVGKTNHHLGEEIRVEIEIDVLFPVLCRVKELGAAALFKLQVKQNDIRRVEVVDRQLEKIS